MQNRNLAWIAPPIAIARAGGVALPCTAPVGLFWIGGIGTLVAGAATPYAWLAGLGLILWVLAGIWSRETVAAIREDRLELRHGCRDGDSTLCRQVPPDAYESDPLDQLRDDQGHNEPGPQGR